MDAASMRRGALWEYLASADWGAVATWLFGFGIVVYLGLNGGGYDPLVHDQIGVAVWWVLLAGALVGALPRRPPSTLAWAALGLLAAFVAWTALSLIWTESLDRTWADVARLVTYLGIFAFALFLRGPKGARLMVGAVAAGIACVAVIALLSRLHPAWFPEADQTARFLSDSRERLAYPLYYWNALAALIAIGIPLLLQVSTCARSVFLRSLAAAALPALALTMFFTLSRGGIAATVLSVGVFLAFASDRLPKALTLTLATAGGAILILVASSQDALRHGLLNATAESQGNRLLAFVLVACFAVGLLQAALTLGLGRGWRPRWTHISRRQSLTALAVCVLALLIAAVAFGVPGRASDAWNEFKRADVPHGGGRLTSVGGEGRYEFWSVAVDEDASKPLTGTGSGTFEYWWDRRGSGGVVRDTHSLYMQTLGELGIVGIVLLVAFLLALLGGGARATLRASPQRRPQLAAALAGCVAFCFTAIFDWVWQVPVLPAATLLLGSILVSATRAEASEHRPALRLRVAFVFLALVAVVAISMPLASTALLRQSEADARAGDLVGALEAAKSAESVQPGAASPRLQQALVLEERRNLTLATQAAFAATARESTNWRTWFVLSRIEAERGKVDAAVRAYRRARSLNPHFSLFEE